MSETAKPFAGGRTGGGERSLWLVAGAGALLAVIFVAWLFSRTPVPPPSAGAPRPAPTVGVTRLDAATDAALREQAELFDPKPLFLPTHRNAQPRNLTGVAPDPGDTVFENFPPILTFDQNGLALDFPAVIRAPARPIEALAVGLPPRPLLGFGRLDLATEPLAPRGGFVEVVAAGSGETILRGELPAAAPPGGDWAPLEFMAAVNAAGLVGPPQLAHSSGRDEVDAYFRTFLVQSFRLGARLPPGFFRVRVGP
ncbi:MAG TPA: hypothetical protein VMI53_08445 [Opitutaceae bacterium]|nr:hypothetical protein [Opitutaceae bacterium]